MSSVTLSTISYIDFITKYNSVRIPDYQRPYRWNKDKIKELLEDFKEFFIDKPVEDLDYYIGGILLYNNKKDKWFEIIDGQQRLTTLNLISYILMNTIQDGQNFHYNNHISFFHINNNYEFLKEQTDLLLQLKEKGFLKRIIFTLIISNGEDQSFAFFDSQNNRGVTLAADDYLKAYHLREVLSEDMQSKFAEQWEHSAIKAQKAKNIEKGLLHLFYKILYRSREWKGQSNIILENKDEILKSFQKRTLKSVNNSYPLFKAKNNVKFTEVLINGNNEIIPQQTYHMQFDQPDTLPFSIRQPLYKGLNFFQFTQKYYSIHQLLFFSPNNTQIQEAQIFYKTVYDFNMSDYLKHYMQLCLVMYYDSFGSEQIGKAVQFFDYFIGSIRISKYYVRQEAIKNSLIKSTNNLLDVIAHAYLPEEVFDFITSHDDIQTIYENEDLDNDYGVRDRYKSRLLKYYNKKENKLAKRLEWIK